MRNGFILIIFLATLIGCQKEEIPFYSGERFLSFTTDISKDSVQLSFFFYPGETELIVPIELTLAGPLYDKEIPVRFVLDKSSTVVEGSYTLPENAVFASGVVKDTFYVKLHKTPELDQKVYKLVLALEATEDYQLGQKEFRNNKILFTAQEAIPEWWTSEITSVYLGEYSSKKFKLFMEVTGVGTLEGLSSSEIRALALKFKRYLKAQNPPVKEEDGSLMTVTVIGE